MVYGDQISIAISMVLQIELSTRYLHLVTRSLCPCQLLLLCVLDMLFQCSSKDY